MNKNILTIATALFVGGSVFLTSCKKDETAPVITLSGDSVQTISLNASLLDPGATANDEKDGAITAITSDYTTAVNKDLAGTYTVTYTASDSKDNQGTKTRTVIVKNDASDYDGLYKYTETCGSVNSNVNDSVRIRISPSSTTNNLLSIMKFANYKNAKVNATVSATNTLTILSQTADNIGTDVESHTFVGNGLRSGSSITVSFSDKNNSIIPVISTDCSGIYTKQ